MAVVTIDSASAAAGSGWNVQGSGSNWFAEKACQNGGKHLAVAATSAALITAMQQVEVNAESFGVHGPKHTSFPGHI